ncbi:ABC transporter substrate-binding protein [Frankia tisae]|uniref:ABC transporter substrate-binding protein n=1 Tax=Frankia tisae TaxID=2950104 RepID=UPI0021BF8F05|nr:ABC transporter substrate-binding protein [Frankia tisae]
MTPPGLTYSFLIRSGVTYSDGTKLDAQNVKRNLEFRAFGDSEGNVRDSNLPAVTSVSADDSAQTVMVKLAKPYPYFLSQLGFLTEGLVSDRYFDLSYAEQGKGPNLIGSGPFVIQSSSQTETNLVKRSGYAWAPTGVSNQGEAYLNSITIIPVQEGSVREGTLESGQADLLHYIDPSAEASAKKRGFQVISQSYPDQVTYQLAVHANAPYLDDINVRKAMLIGIDRQKLVDTEPFPATGRHTPRSITICDGRRGVGRETRGLGRK